MGKERKIWLNGEMIPEENATVNVMSHAFTRGAAIFEIFGVHKTPDGPAAFRMDDHLKRFEKSIELLDMELPRSINEIKQAAIDCVKTNNIEDVFVRIMAYHSGESYSTVPPDGDLDILILAFSFDPFRGGMNKPVSACISKWRKLHPQTVPVECKVSGNYVNGMMSSLDAKKRGFGLGIMLDTQGFLAELSTASIFIVKDGVLMTSPLGTILSSVSRRTVIAVARAEGIEVIEKAIRADEILDADEIFSSSTALKVWSVNRIEDRDIEDAPGPVSTQLSRTISGICSGSDERFKDWLTLMK